jgi:uncharacterized protein (TIGR03083 family)
MPAAGGQTYDAEMDIAAAYLQAQRSFVDLVADLTDDEWATPAPCTPGWTVRDILSHVSGVTNDVTEGNVDGAATEPWTAAQVQRWRDTPVDEMIARWNEQIGPIAEALELFGEHRPPLDCHSHEHDVRHALGRPGNQDSELIRWMTTLFGESSLGRPIEVTFTDGSSLTSAGEGHVVQLSGVTRFDLVRARLGRRSLRQVRSWNWSSPLTDGELAAWFVFGPTEYDITE